jgi:MFS family permease
VTYLGSVISLLLMRTPEPQPPAPAQRRALLTELADGLRFVLGNRHLRAVAVVGGACNLVIAAIEPIFVLYAVRSRGMPASALGLVLSIGAAGGVVGALSAGRLIKRLPPGRVYVLALCLAFPALLLIPLAGGPRLAVEALFTVAFFISLSGIALVNVLILTLRQTITPPAFLGRMNAAMRAVMFGLGAVGGPAAGVLAAQFGLRSTLWVFGLAGVVFTVSAFFSPVARLRELPAPVPAPTR